MTPPTAETGEGGEGLHLRPLTRESTKLQTLPTLPPTRTRNARRPRVNDADQPRRGTTAATAVAHETRSSVPPDKSAERGDQDDLARSVQRWAEQLGIGQKAVLTTHETADLLRISERSVRQGIYDGTIPCVRLGRRVLVPVPVLLDALLRNGPSRASVASDGQRPSIR